MQGLIPVARPMAIFGAMILLMLVQTARAAESSNLWQSSFGQRWFYESGSAGDVLAGSWWESSLTPGATYQITFDVNAVRGNMVLLIGNEDAIRIDAPGSYSYDFNITENGRRRLLFQARSSDAMGSVAEISVSRRWTWGSDSGSSGSDGGTGSTGGGSNWIPQGHYVSFARTRNLKTEMLDLVDQPWTARSNYHLNQARGMHDALTTAGVQGFWVEYPWGDIETADGRYNWSVIDDNMAVARRLGLKAIIKISDRSFDGTNPLPSYFPSRYVLWTSGGGKRGYVSKRWEHYVYSRLIRLYRAIAYRYASDSAFGGIATAETALGSAGSHADYSERQYRNALTQVVTQTQASLGNGKLFFYLNFLRGGDHADMNHDKRVALLDNVPHDNLIIGAPDITPDVPGMPGSVNSYRIHARRAMNSLEQFCHLQHVDQGLFGVNVKSNQHRRDYIQQMNRVRDRERQSWFNGTRAVFETDVLDPSGSRPDLHPNWAVGQLWQPDELFRYGTRNFGCDYVLWHYRDNPGPNEFGWQDVRSVILQNQYFYQW